MDSSFAGDWNRSWSQDSTSVFSRTGYVVVYVVCPITWQSKLQIEISLSTFESECIVLSQSLKEALPTMTLI